jgi:hypothetical protein
MAVKNETETGGAVTVAAIVGNEREGPAKE